MDKLAEDYQDKYPDLSELISEHAWETLGVYHAAPPATDSCPSGATLLGYPRPTQIQSPREANR